MYSSRCLAKNFDADCYRPHLDAAQAQGPCEVMLMTSQALNALGPEQRHAYYSIAEHITVPALVHALEPAFVPWATPFEPWLLYQLARHPKFTGGKISTLDEPHFLHWAAMTKDLNLDFSPHSGDDFGIASAIKMGLPLLIGAGVSACPLICAAKSFGHVNTSMPESTNSSKHFSPWRMQSFVSMGTAALLPTNIARQSYFNCWELSTQTKYIPTALICVSATKRRE